MFGILSRQCLCTSKRVWAAPAPVCSSLLPAGQLAVFGAGWTARGQCTKRTGLGDFLAEIGIPTNAATKMAGRANLQKSRVSTTRTNYNGLAATLGSEGALAAICRSSNLLKSPPETTSGAHAAYVDIHGADGAAQAILKNPNLLCSPAANIKKVQKTLVEFLSADGAAELISQAPAVLNSGPDTAEGVLKAIVDVMGADQAAVAILKTLLCYQPVLTLSRAAIRQLSMF